MAALPPRGKTVTRRPTFKGVMMQDVSNGVERNRKWPRSRGKSLHPNTLDQMDWFRQAQWATKYMDQKIMVSFMEATKGTPLLPRDIATMMFAGRWLYFRLPNGRKVFSVQALKDVSASLDVISQTPGHQLLRGPEYWYGVPQITGNRVGVMLRRPAVTAAPNTAAGYTISWTNEDIDQAAYWNIAQPTRIVIPQTGWYNVCFNARKSGGNSSPMTTFLFQNGTQIMQNSNASTTATGGTGITLNYIGYFHAGDYLELAVRSTLGTSNINEAHVTVVGNA